MSAYSSLGPIYTKNGPVDEFERTGLEAVAKYPGSPIQEPLQKVPHVISRQYLRIGPSRWLVSYAITVIL